MKNSRLAFPSQFGVMQTACLSHHSHDLNHVELLSLIVYDILDKECRMAKNSSFPQKIEFVNVYTSISYSGQKQIGII